MTREKGTERAFTGACRDHEERGRYHCVCCGAELFHAEHERHSRSGWPSFTRAGNPDSIGTEEDRSHFAPRTEIVCNGCGAHLGHAFDDGPGPAGQRFGVNSASLEFGAEP